MIYCVSNKQVSSINLWKVDSNTFRIFQFGEFTTLMVGANYTIVNKSIITAFDELLSDEIEIEPIKITRKSTGEEWNDFYKLIIKEHITPEKFKICNENERDIWQFHHHPFVSEHLKNKLEVISNGQLSFSEGFSNFG